MESMPGAERATLGAPTALTTEKDDFIIANIVSVSVSVSGCALCCAIPCCSSPLSCGDHCVADGEP